MKVVNIHERTINQQKNQVWRFFETLSSDNDMVVATNKWSRMTMDKGLQVGSKGGHGPIGYSIQEFIPCELIKFEFTKPRGFYGYHKFELSETEEGKTKIKHTIEMDTSYKGYLLWIFAIRWLHDAFIEDAFDKVENHFAPIKKFSEWSLWVKLLRSILKPKKEKR